MEHERILEGDLWIAPTAAHTAKAEAIVSELVALHWANHETYLVSRDRICMSLLETLGAAAVIGPAGDETISALVALVDEFVAAIVSRAGGDRQGVSHHDP